MHSTPIITATNSRSDVREWSGGMLRKRMAILKNAPLIRL